MTELVGLRRLFEAVGVRIDGAGLFVRQFTFPDGYRGEVRVSQSPAFGITVNWGTGFLDPNYEGQVLQTKRHKDPKDAGLSGKWFTEILVFREVDPPASLSADFREGKPGAESRLFSLVHHLEAEMRDRAEFLSAFAGLRFHRQLVGRFMAEDFVAPRKETYAWKAASEGLELLDAWLLPGSLDAPVIELLPSEELSKGSTAMPWLTRAWSSKDPIVQLLSLFIPLEVCLGGVSAPLERRLQNACDVLEKHLNAVPEAEGDRLRDALSTLKGSLRPSLVDRFAKLAETANMPEWQKDVRAIRLFNRRRNALLHRGDRKVTPVLSPDHKPDKLEGEEWVEELEHLQDIVERYVSFRLFGDAHVYPFRWRAQRATSKLKEG